MSYAMLLETQINASVTLRDSLGPSMYLAKKLAKKCESIAMSAFTRTSNSYRKLWWLRLLYMKKMIA